MQPTNSEICPSCGNPLLLADVFDQQAGFGHADCACGYHTKPTIKAGVRPVEDAERAVHGLIGEGYSLLDFYGSASTKPELHSWAFLAEACLQRLLQGFDEYLTLVSQHGRPAFHACNLVAEHSGVGPRSGGGIATSGAGAERKEGVQPPGGFAVAAVGVLS